MILTIVFFGLIYAYLWLYVGTPLLYEGHQLGIGGGRRIVFPMYLLGGRFFEAFVGYPGGLTDYAAAFLSQYYYFAWLGAMILTAGAFAVFLLGHALLRTVAGPAAKPLRFIAPLLLLLAYNRYLFLLTDVLSLIVAVGLAYLYVRLRPGNRAARVIVVAAVSSGLAYLVGIEYILFAVLCGLVETADLRRGWFVWLSCFVFAAAPVLLCKYALDLPVWGYNASTRPYHYYSGAVRMVTYLGPWVYFSLATVCFVHRSHLVRLGSKLPSRIRAVVGYLRSFKLRMATPGVAVLLAGGVVAFGTRDTDTSALLWTNYFARRGMWPDVVTEARRIPEEKFSLRIMSDVNRALFETRLLGDLMFHYPQSPDGLVLLYMESVDSPAHCETLYELGLVNFAEHAACDLLEFYGPRPVPLKMIVKIKLAKGEVEAAKVFLRVLSKDVIHGRWARQELRRVESCSTTKPDAEAGRADPVMVRGDWVCPARVQAAIFDELWRENEHNRMAFEYMLAIALLNRRPKVVAEEVRHLKGFGYKRAPNHYAEAALLHLGIKKDKQPKPPDFGELKVSQEVFEHVRTFGAILARHLDSASRKKSLVKNVPDTYFRYYYAGRPGGTK
ncbi:MAG: DUF6057 family protein [Planctomycetota bacterium]